MSRSNAIRYSHWFLAPALIVYAVFFLVPNLTSVYFSFTDWNIDYIDDMKFNGIENFRQMLDSSILRTAIWNTLFFTVATSLAKVVFGFLLAVVLSGKLKLTAYYRVVLFAPIIISTMVVGLVFSAIYNPRYGILNRSLETVGLGSWTQEWLVNAKTAMLSICAMDIWQGTGFCMVVFFAGIQSIPKDYFDCAQIDGAGFYQKTKSIVIPLIMPSFNVSLLISMISGLKVFAQVIALTNGGPADRTQVVASFIYKSFGNGLFGLSSAVGLVFAVIVSLASILILRVLRKLEVEM